MPLVNFMQRVEPRCSAASTGVLGSIVGPLSESSRGGDLHPDGARFMKMSQIDRRPCLTRCSDQWFPGRFSHGLLVFKERSGRRNNIWLFLHITQQVINVEAELFVELG